MWNVCNINSKAKEENVANKKKCGTLYYNRVRNSKMQCETKPWNWMIVTQNLWAKMKQVKWERKNYVTELLKTKL